MEDLQYEYNVNVKDKIKKLEANKTTKNVRLVSESSPKKGNEIGAQQIQGIINPDQNPAIMDVEITQQLNSPNLKTNYMELNENSIKKRNSVTTTSTTTNIESDEEEEPPMDVKSLLRRFSVGVTQTFRKKSLTPTEIKTTDTGDSSNKSLNKYHSLENDSSTTRVNKSQSTSNLQTPTNNSNHQSVKLNTLKSNSTSSGVISETKSSKSPSKVPPVAQSANKNSSFETQSTFQNNSFTTSERKLSSGSSVGLGISKSMPFNAAKLSNKERVLKPPQTQWDIIPKTPVATIVTKTSNSGGTQKEVLSTEIVEHNEKMLPQPKPRPRNTPAQKNTKQRPISIGTSLHNASILVFGPGRAGKSSIVNYLLKQDLSTVSTNPPQNRDIVECTANVTGVSLKTELESVKIIDAPAFNNDEGDASLISTLISTLNEGSQESTPPTIALVVIKFEEHKNYLDCEELTNFFKVIFHYQQNICNFDFSNVLFILTHSTPQKTHSIQGAIKELSEVLRQCIISITNPLIAFHALSQNKYEGISNSELVSKEDLTPFSLLPSLTSLLSKQQTGALLVTGYEILRETLGSNYPDSIKQCFVSKRIPLKSAQHPETIRVQKTLQNIYLNMSIEATEISTLLEIGWENVNTKLRQKYPSSLLTLQQIFQKYRIRNFGEIPEEPLKVLDILKQIPQHNPAITDLLGETLQLKVPSCFPALYLGQGYDVSKDAVINVSPFQFSGTLKTSPVGLIPEEIGCKLMDDREIIFKFYYTFEDYVLDRLKDMSIKYVTFPTNNQPVSSNQRIGYNVIKPNQEPTKTTTATAMIEYRIFQLSIGRGEEIEFKPQFWDALTTLPELDVKKLETVECWREFFNYWGTHVVKSANGGGSIQVNFRGKMLTNIFKSLKQDTVLPSDEDETSKVFQWITGDGLDFISTKENSKAEFLQGCDVDSSFKGGDMRFQQIDLTKLPYEKVAAIRDEWIQSLTLNPIILETNLYLVPISYFVRSKSEGIATKMDVAFHYFYSNFMTSQGKSCVIL